MATAHAIVPTDEKADSFRLLSLIIDGGTTVLRYKFDQCIPPNDLQKKLNDTSVRGKLNSLRQTKALTSQQWQLIYPLHGQPNSADFDVSLLTCLLRYICGLDEQSPMWNCIPPSFNTSVEADITRLRQCRNEMSHMKSTHLTKLEFQQKWDYMEQVILRLGSGIPDLSQNIQSLKEDNIDPSKERQLTDALKEWEEMDNCLAIELEKVNARLDDVNCEIDQVKESIIKHEKRTMESENELKSQGHKLDSMMKTELDTDNRLETLNTEVTEIVNKITSIEDRQNTLDLNVTGDRNKFDVEKAIIYDRLDKTDMKTNEIETAMLELKSKEVEDKKGRYEDMSSELKSLASMTELHLENIFLEQIYVTTNAHNQAKEILNKSGCLILSGLPGEGKTTMASKIISEITQPGRCLKLREPSDWRHVDLSKNLVDTIFIDDIFGAGALDENLLRGWKTFLPDLEQAIKRKKIVVVITSRHYILEEAREKICRLKLFKDENVQLLTSSDLTQSERTEILEAHLRHSNKPFGSTLLEDCNIAYNTSFKNLHFEIPEHVSETGELSDYLRAGKLTRIKAMKSLIYLQTTMKYLHEGHLFSSSL